MSKRLFTIVHALLLLQVLATAAIAANVDSPSDALWRFETHG